MTVETITIINTSVRSSSKHKRAILPSKIPLSGLDSFTLPAQILFYWFFHPQPGSISNLLDKLQTSLAEALEFYPPVSGTVRSDDNGNLYIAMDDKNTTQGTPFLFEVKGVPYMDDAIDQDLSPRPGLALHPGASTLAVKVTQFSCGTVAVATSLHHQVADPRGFVDFLQVWAQLARGERVDLKKVPRDWSRTLHRVFPSLPPEKPTTTPPAFASPLSPATSGLDRFLAPYEATRWKISKNAIARLKADLSPPVDSCQWISSGDALTSLVFGAITRARESGQVTRSAGGRSNLESRTETLVLPADCRYRLPEVEGRHNGGNYFGNLYNLCRSTVARSDLLSPTVEGASRVALTIRSDLNTQLTPEAIANQIAFFEDHKTTKSPDNVIASTADLLVSNWCRFDLQGSELDFGWGKSFKAKRGTDDQALPGFVTMTLDKESGDVLVILGVEREGAEQLKADPLLGKYATLTSIVMQ